VRARTPALSEQSEDHPRPAGQDFTTAALAKDYTWGAILPYLEKTYRRDF